MSIDVAAKLAQGAAAVGAIETYVAASQAVGLPAGGLTVAGVRELYAAEAGMRLDAIAADSDALAKLADTAEEGMRLEAEACDAVRESWQGASGTAAAEFVERHLAGGAALVAALRDASAALRSLRDELAALVEHKVGTAVDFDDRRAAEHPVWLAEAEAVLQGLADDVAVEVVARHISPFVDGDVQSDWMPAMRDATDSVAAAYDEAVTRLSDRPGPQFASPGTGSAGAFPPGPADDTWSAPPAPAGPLQQQQWSPPAQAQWPQWPSGLSNAMSSGLPDIGGLGGASGMGGGLSALIGRIADVLGSYAGSPDLSATDEITPPQPKVNGDSSTKSGDEKSADRESDPDQSEQDQEADSETIPGRGDEPVAEVPAAAVAQPIGGVPLAQLAPPELPQPVPLAPPAPLTQAAQLPEPVPPRQVEPAATDPASPSAPPSQPLPHPLAAEAAATPARVTAKPAEKPETPCSIAADELPQVGQ